MMVVTREEINQMTSDNPNSIVVKKLNASETEPAIYELQEVESGDIKYWWGVYQQDEHTRDEQLN